LGGTSGCAGQDYGTEVIRIMARQGAKLIVKEREKRGYRRLNRG
jgi:hypothetical protein